jgi:hypothetical protein
MCLLIGRRVLESGEIGQPIRTAAERTLAARSETDNTRDKGQAIIDNAYIIDTCNPAMPDRRATLYYFAAQRSQSRLEASYRRPIPAACKQYYLSSPRNGIPFTPAAPSWRLAARYRPRFPKTRGA